MRTHLAAALGLLAAACSEAGAAPDAAAPAATVTIAAAADGITSVVPFEDALVVTAQLDGTAGDADYVFRVGDMVKSMAKAIQAGAADDADEATELDLAVSSAATDRLGKPRTVHVMTLTLPMADLRAARLDNLSVGRVLNLTTDISFGAHGAQQLLAYCAGERGRVQSQAFCTLAASKAPA